ncbi:MAG: ribonuclease P protein subunit [Fervidicoccaceae archaeon]|jgi:RNase P/RNase MRP subunit p29|uniref:Uncharacterized protein n=1 Tax=Fervidicoccus fontis TaxID=683846 RepID=A0A7C1E9H4_9CREN
MPKKKPFSKSPRPSDLIGRRARVVWAINPSLRDLEGELCGETLRTIALRTPRGVKVLLKDGLVLEVETNKGRRRIEGWMIKGRMYERK